MSRLNSSIPLTDEVTTQIEKVRKHYGDQISGHKVLSGATLIGLRLLATDPTQLPKAK